MELTKGEDLRVVNRYSSSEFWVSDCLNDRVSDDLQALDLKREIGRENGSNRLLDKSKVRESRNVDFGLLLGTVMHVPAKRKAKR
jgi:hypothetical protein